MILRDKMSDSIQVGFDPKTRRLLFKAPFFLNDVLRSLPSRRWDPKTKSWKAPLTKQNIGFINDHRGRYDFQITGDAQEAILNMTHLMAAPVHIPFPRQWYDDMAAWVTRQVEAGLGIKEKP